jgi:hypothetical protein
MKKKGQSSVRSTRPARTGFLKYNQPFRESFPLSADDVQRNRAAIQSSKLWQFILSNCSQLFEHVFPFVETKAINARGQALPARDARTKFLLCFYV